MSGTAARRHPPWLKVRAPGGPGFVRTRETIRGLGLHTVCEEARCPNVGECWGHGTATFMLLGDTCTRRCAFCAVAHGRPGAVDPEEPERVAAAVARLDLRHVVVTSVDRDDLPDGGAAHFAATAEAVKRMHPSCRVEVLVPDFQGDAAAVETVVRAPIDVFNHNVETVPRLYRRVRPGARYERSLDVLARAARPGLLTKTGLMLGLGEAGEELLSVFTDLRRVGCEILTLGQYLRPTGEARHLPVERYVPPEEFESLGRSARALGFRHVEAGPLVRSSYHAWSHVPT